MSEKNSVRDQIIDAAKKRFSHFGYAKTTMAEVAADCAMSPRNHRQAGADQTAPVFFVLSALPVHPLRGQRHTEL